MQKIAIVFCFWVFVQSDLFAQNNYTYSVGSNIFAGNVLKHHFRSGHLVTSYPIGMEVFINKNTYGQKPWEIRYKYPNIGLSLAYFDFDNPALGQILAATVYFELYLLRKKHHQLSFKIGTGQAYATAPFNQDFNNKNNLIGSRFTYTMQGRLTYYYQLNQRFKLTAALTLSHFSNGAIRKPNLGVNVVSLNIGGLYRLQENQPDHITKIQSTSSPKYWINTTLYAGARYVIFTGAPYPFYGFNTYLAKPLSPISALQIGLDGFYDLALRSEIETDPNLTNQQKSELDFKRIGVFLGHELLIGKLGFVIQVGYHAYSPYRSGDDVYQRYGLKYYIKDHFSMSLAFKSNFSVAQGVEYGIGYRFIRN